MHVKRRPRPAELLAGWLAIAVVGAVSAAFGQAPGAGEKATLQLALDRSAYEPGTTATVAARIEIERHWHTNSHEPTFDYLIPTELTFSLPEGWPAAEIQYPRGEMKTFAFADKPISVYDGSVVILARIQLPESTVESEWSVEASLRYQACDDRSCLPPTVASASTVLVVGPNGTISTDPVFASAGSAVPMSPQKSPNLIVILLLGVLGGLILNAMPCVLPVLSLKIFGLVKSASHGRSQVVLGSLATSLGIVLSFWALALAAVIAKSAGGAVGWGVQFQEPLFVTVLAIVVLLFCLNLWGVFEIPLPQRLARVADSGPKEGIPGHLASGLFATLMATPCSAPFLGTAVGFALSQSAVTIFAVFTSIALGMALPYLALAAFPGAARFLPKPGPWMQKLRVVMGFLLAGAAIWLFYVLAAQMSRERVAFVELALLILALFVWTRHQAAKREFIKVISTLGILLSMGAALALASGSTRTPAVGSEQPATGLIGWAKFDRQKAESLVQEGRLVFVDVTADWCFTCKVNEELVLETPEIAEAFARFEIIPMKADWTSRSDAIARFLSDHGRYGIPFYLLYRPGQAPHVFGELLTKEGLISVIEDAASSE